MTRMEQLKNTYLEFLSAGIDISKPIVLDEIITSGLVAGLSKLSLSASLPAYFSESLNFPADTDVGVFKHINYLPTFIHSHEYYEIVYVIKGSCTNHFLDHQIDMVTGDILIILPGKEHALSVFDDETQVVNIVVRSSTFATSFLSVLQGDDVLSSFFLFSQQGVGTFSYVLFSTGDDERLKSLIHSAYEEHCSNLPHKKRILNATLNLFFLELLRRHESHIKYPFAYSSHKTLEAMNLLQYVYDNHSNITLKELANHFSYSPRNISRLLKKYTGQTFTELVSNIKLREATNLLTSSTLTISKIAELSGYATTGQFYRAFRNEYDISPSTYRKTHNKNM